MNTKLLKRLRQPTMWMFNSHKSKGKVFYRIKWHINSYIFQVCPIEFTRFDNKETGITTYTILFWADDKIYKEITSTSYYELKQKYKFFVTSVINLIDTL